MRRRDFLRTAGGATAAASVAAGSAAASDGTPARPPALQEENGTEEETQPGDGGNETEGGEEGGLPGAGETETVIVGPSGDQYSFDPDELYVLPGTEVIFQWESDNHNLVVEEGPDDGWPGYEDTENAGFEYSYTFEVEGEYHYFCRPHQANGMEADIIVTPDPPEQGGGEEEELDPAHMGIPLQKHFIGITTFAALFVSLIFIFYVLKYGESAHTSAPGKED